MSSESDFRESVDKTREAFRRSVADGQDEFLPQRAGAPHIALAERPVAASDPAGLHPFFHGLLDILPEPGATWPPEQRERWLETARNIFCLLYQDGEGERMPIPLHGRAPEQPRAEPRYGEHTG